MNDSSLFKNRVGSEDTEQGIRRVTVENGQPQGVILTQLDEVVNWARKNSLWPFLFGPACCGIEFMTTCASRYVFCPPCVDLPAGAE